MKLLLLMPSKKILMLLIVPIFLLSCKKQQNTTKEIVRTPIEKKDSDLKVAMQYLLDTLKMKSEKHNIRNVLKSMINIKVLLK